MILSTSGCPKLDYILTVTLSEGVEGTPASGSYSYEEFTMVNYSYSPKPGYSNLEVYFQGINYPNSGSVAVNGEKYLNVIADKIISPLDIRGFWIGHQYCSSIDFNLEVTFSGGLNSGEAAGMVGQSEANGTGTFTLSSDEKTITFDLAIPSQGITFYFEGTMNGDNKMSGTYYTKPAQWSGTWELHR